MNKEAREQRNDNIIELRKKGISTKALATMFGLKPDTVNNICSAIRAKPQLEKSSAADNAPIYAECEDCRYWRPLGQGTYGYNACHYCIDSNALRELGANDTCLSFAEGDKRGKPWSGIQLRRSERDYEQAEV